MRHTFIYKSLTTQSSLANSSGINSKFANWSTILKEQSSFSALLVKWAISANSLVTTFPFRNSRGWFNYASLSSYTKQPTGRHISAVAPRPPATRMWHQLMELAILVTSHCESKPVLHVPFETRASADYANAFLPHFPKSLLMVCEYKGEVPINYETLTVPITVLKSYNAVVSKKVNRLKYLSGQKQRSKQEVQNLRYHTSLAIFFSTGGSKKKAKTKNFPPLNDYGNQRLRAYSQGDFIACDVRLTQHRTSGA